MTSLTDPFPRRRTLRRGDELAASGLAAPDQAVLIDRAGEIFPVAITPHLADSASDAVIRQFVPQEAELAEDAAGRADPIGDAAHSPVRGIVHRYPDRVLLTPLLACPAYCRFCFRRAQVGGPESMLSEGEIEAAFAYIDSRPEIWEVILSGGDPLMLPAKRLSAIIARLSGITHVAAVRVHTRVPIIDPARVTPALVGALATEKAMFAVIHCNHADELNEPARAACRQFVRAGIPMLSQTVLLKGVNDDAQTMAALMRALVANRIKPYYLHHPDLAAGTAHFRVPLERGQAIVRRLRGRISGLCQPSYVLDIPGGHGKVLAGTGYVESDGRGGHRVTDWQGRVHAYPPAADEPGDIAAEQAT